MISRLAAGAALAATAALVARRKGWLTPDGALASGVVGSAVFAGTGVRGSAGMLTFFTSSSLLGRLPSTRFLTQRRGNARDAVQVLANGGIPAALALATWLAPESARPRIITAFGGALAAATADTWATEIGTRYGRAPRSILTLQPVPAGSSGAISPAGLLASVAGATLIASLLAPPISGSNTCVTRAITCGGLAGSLLDSSCGAAWQEVRYCDSCQSTTESLVHTCGNQTRHLRGYAWCNNDVVNVIAVAAGALVAASLHPAGDHAACQPAAALTRLTSRDTERVEFTPRAMHGAQFASISKSASA